MQDAGKDTIAKALKSKWTYVTILGLIGLVSGGAYSDQIVQMILSILGQ